MTPDAAASEEAGLKRLLQVRVLCHSNRHQAGPGPQWISWRKGRGTFFLLEISNERKRPCCAEQALSRVTSASPPKWISTQNFRI